MKKGKNKPKTTNKAPSTSARATLIIELDDIYIALKLVYIYYKDINS